MHVKCIDIHRNTREIEFETRRHTVRDIEFVIYM